MTIQATDANHKVRRSPLYIIFILMIAFLLCTIIWLWFENRNLQMEQRFNRSIGHTPAEQHTAPE